MQAGTSKRGKLTGRKRTRIPLACDLCRERKVRCDGVKPTCGECSKRLTQCIYGKVDNQGRDDSQRDYIRSLHDRIHALEEAQSHHGTQNLENTVEHSPPAATEHHLLHTVDDRQIAETSDLHQDQAAQVDPDLFSPPSQSRVLNKSKTSPTSAQYATKSSSNDPDSTQRESTVNAMGANFSVPISSQTDDDSLYGQSSIASLASQIPQNQSQDETSPRSTSFTSGSHMSHTSRFRAAKRVRYFSLPTRSDADHLLDQFWRNFHLFYPWIHFPSFLKAYESLWTNQRTGTNNMITSRVGLGGRKCSQTVFHCALNVIFALGCEFTDSTQQSGENPGGEFMDRANELFSISLLDDEGLSVVQTLLLFSIYLQSTRHPQQCWGVAGLSLRMAQGIGLHLEPTSTSHNILETEMRRRVWHGCLLMDRVVSMSLGRLPTPLADIPVPMFSAVDDEYLEPTSESPKQPDSVFSRVQFAVSQCELGEILGRIQKALYCQHPDDQSQNYSKNDPNHNGISTDAVLALEDSLDSFEISLPPPLSYQYETSSHDQLTSPFVRQRLSIQTKLLHAKVMLYRPFLATNLQSKNVPQADEEGQTTESISRRRESIRSVFALECAAKCFQTAGELIEVLHQATLGQFYGAWWYGLFYLMTACTILIISESAPHLADALDDARLAQLWVSATEILNFLGAKHHMASQCADTLQELRARASSTRQQALAGNFVNMQPLSTDLFQQNVSATLPQPSERAGKSDLNFNWMASGPSPDMWGSNDHETNQGLRNQNSTFWPMLQGFQTSSTEAANFDMAWGGLDQSWHWTPF